MKFKTLFMIFLFACFQGSKSDNEKENVNEIKQTQIEIDKKKYSELKITVETPTYKIDLYNRTYTVFFFDSRKNVQQKFFMSKQEDSLLFNIFLQLNIDTLTKSIELSCLGTDLPKINTKLQIENTKSKIKVLINEECEFHHKSIGNNIAYFIKSIKEIIESKKEIQELPISDIKFI